jgi:hypothetical protein
MAHLSPTTITADEQRLVLREPLTACATRPSSPCATRGVGCAGGESMNRSFSDRFGKFILAGVVLLLATQWRRVMEVNESVNDSFSDLTGGHPWLAAGGMLALFAIAYTWWQSRSGAPKGR